MTITSTAYQKRFTDAAAETMERLFDRFMENTLDLDLKPLPPRFKRFKDILAVKSTVFFLRDELERV